MYSSLAMLQVRGFALIVGGGIAIIAALAIVALVFAGSEPNHAYEGCKGAVIRNEYNLYGREAPDWLIAERCDHWLD